MSTTRGPGQESPATQVLEQGSEVAGRAREAVQETAGQVSERARGRLRRELDRRSTEVGSHGQTVAEALRRTGRELEGRGEQAPARAVQAAAERIERGSGYLRDADADRILSDLEHRARERPWLAAGAGALLGFVASRFLKASSGYRYDERRLATPRPLAAGSGRLAGGGS